MSTQFLALSWTSRDEEEARRLLSWAAAAPYWTRRLSIEGCEVWTGGRGDLPVHSEAEALLVLIGRTFPNPDSRRIPDAAFRDLDNPSDVARAVVTSRWGEYLALIRAPEGARWVLRDPSGAVGALTWICRRVGVVASDLTEVPGPLLPPQMRMNWDTIADWVRRPLTLTSASALEGVHLVAPGEVRPMGAESSAAQRVWRPTDWLPAGKADLQEAEARLRGAVDTAVGALTAAHPRLLVEVSGGLDSAVVATTAARSSGYANLVAPLHLVDRDPEGDERAWAELVFADIGLAPSLQPLDLPRMADDPYAAFSHHAAPSFNALDPARTTGSRLAALAYGADAVMTGKGGDAVFFQHPTPMVLADFVRSQGWPAAFQGQAQLTARWLRRSIWSVIADARMALRAGDWPRAASTLLGPRARWAAASPGHPWLEDLRDATPAKRFQIEAIVQTQLHRGPSALTEVADLVHPLLSQPVLEAALSIPSWHLVCGGRERGLARRAFADRVPAPILARRSKGQLSRYFGQMVATNLDVLRPHLLDGALAEARILDRGALEQALTVEALIWREDPIAILAAAVTESWVRRWQRLIPDSAVAPRTQRP